MIEAVETKMIDVGRIESLGKELKANGREADAANLVTLLTMVVQADEYYTSKEVSEKFNVSEDIVIAFVRKGSFDGVVVGDLALLPKKQFAEFDRVEHLSKEFDKLVGQYTQDELEELISEVRQEWQRQGLF